MSETTGTELTVHQGEQWLQSLSDLSPENLAELKALSSSVMVLQANTGRIAVETGKALGRIRSMLVKPMDNGGEDTALWDRWVQHFAYSRDYASRMIRVAERVQSSPQLQANLDQLSFRHLREIDRFARGEGSEEVMVQAIVGSGLGVEQTRWLVTQSKQGKLDVAKLVQENPNLKPVIDQLQKQMKEEAAAESRSKNAELKDRVRELQTATEELKQDNSTKSEQLDKLTNAYHTQKAAEDIGEGDPEKGMLRIELEQLKQQMAQKDEALTQVSGDLARVQSQYEDWRHSATGVSKLDFRKSADEIAKFFSTTMTPAAVLARVQGVEAPEAREEMLRLLDLVDGWVAELRAGLTPQVA